MKTWKKAVLLILPLAAVILCFLPDGIKMVFAPSPDTRTVSFYPYWHLLPVGYGVFAPMLTLAAAVALIILAAVGMKRSTVTAIKAVSAAAFILSVLPVAVEAYTGIGVVISVLLAAEFILSLTFSLQERKNM